MGKFKKEKIRFCFRRQYSIGPYFVDFYCPQKRLAIELDGKQHINAKDYDDYRTEYLKALNIKVLRFWNSEVENSIIKVLEVISSSL